MNNLRLPRVGLLVIATTALASCAPGAGGGKSSTETNVSTNTSGGGPGVGTAPPPFTGTGNSTANLTASIGVRNFDQVNAMMESVTGAQGFSAAYATFNNDFDVIKAQLPTFNGASQFGWANQSAITTLASQYCSALVTNSTYAPQLATAIGTFAITQPPMTAITTASSAALAQSLINQFWGSNYASNANATSAAQTVAQLLSALSTGQPNTAATTKNAVIGACTAVLASAPATMF